MEIDEKGLLSIVANHLEVTEKLLEHYIKMVQLVQLSAGAVVFEKRPTLEDMRVTTVLLQQRARAILEGR